MQPFENCVFQRVFQSFRMAIQLSKLIIAFCAIILIWIAGWAMDFATRSVVTAEVTARTQSTSPRLTELDVYLAKPGTAQSFVELNAQTGARTGVFHTLWHFGAAKFHLALIALFELDIPAVKTNIDQYIRAIAWAFEFHPLYSGVFVLLILAVIAVAGGAICRISALQFARGEKPGLIEAIGFSLKRFRHFYFAPLFPVAVIIILTLVFFAIPGLLTNIPRAGEIIIAICTPFLMLIGAVIAIAVIGLTAGFSLMFPAIAYSGLEFFDAISHAFSYIFTRPWRMTLYSVLAAIYGAACYFFVRFLAFLILLSTHTCINSFVWAANSKGLNKFSAIWPTPTFMDLSNASALAPANATESIAAFLISLSLFVIIGLLVSFVTSFFFSANTIIYALMRNKVDRTPFDDVYTGFDETSATKPQ